MKVFSLAKTDRWLLFIVHYSDGYGLGISTCKANPPSGGEAISIRPPSSAARSLIPSDGHLPVAPMPSGPDPMRLSDFEVADAETVDWWRARLKSVQGYL